MTITYVDGDLFDLFLATGDPKKNKIIAHVANDQLRMNGGFAKALVEHYPIVAEKSKITVLGVAEYIEVRDNVTVVNMIAQHKSRREVEHPLKYGALVSCMYQVYSISRPVGPRLEIHCPMFGSLRAGGNWEVIEQMVEEIWEHIPVYVYRKIDPNADAIRKELGSDHIRQGQPLQ